MLSQQGIRPTETHAIGCLGSAKERLIIEKVLINGHTFRGIIDTGATSSFIPLQGEIIKLIKPQLFRTGGRVETLGNEIGLDIHRTCLMMKPESASGAPSSSNLLVIATGTHILGHDLIIGIPELERWGLSLVLTPTKSQVIWQSEPNTNETLALISTVTQTDSTGISKPTHSNHLISSYQPHKGHSENDARASHRVSTRLTASKATQTAHIIESDARASNHASAWLDNSQNQQPVSKNASTSSHIIKESVKNTSTSTSVPNIKNQAASTAHIIKKTINNTSISASAPKKNTQPAPAAHVTKKSVKYNSISASAPNQINQVASAAHIIKQTDNNTSITASAPNQTSQQSQESIKQVHQSKLDSITKQYSEVFSKSLNGSYMRTEPAQIHLTNYYPISCRGRRHSPDEISQISEQIERLKKNDIIEVSQSPYSSNCRLVPKKNGKQRLIINYIPLNRSTIKDEYPLPMITDIMQALAGHKIFSVLDATEGFHQVPLDQHSKQFTAFLTPLGLYQYKRVPFGFVNSPAIFQRAMNEVFAPGLYKKCAVYVDDIIVFGRNQLEHDANLQWTLERCRQFNLKINPAKCQLSKTEVQFLGRKLTGQGIEIDQTNIQTVEAFPTPKTQAEVRAILGSLQFLSKYIPNFSELTRPLVKLTCKDVEFIWTAEHTKAMEKITNALHQAKPSYISTKEDFKRVHLYVLPQSIEVVCEDQSGRFIDRASRLLSQSEQNYTIVERNLLALVLACNKFETLLDNINTVFTTDCKELVKEIKRVNRAKRVEHLLLQITPSIEPNLEIREDDAADKLVRFAAETPDAIFYTDGASTANGKDTCKAAWAVYWLEKPEESISGLVAESPSNQTAELQAVIEACKLAKFNKLKKIAIVSDSKYVLSSIEKWLPKWRENEFLNYKNKPVVNQKLIRELADHTEGLDINWCFVKGHNQNFGNTKADELAKSVLSKSCHKIAAALVFGEAEQLKDPTIRRIHQQLSNQSQQQANPKYTIINGLVHLREPTDDDPENTRLIVPKDQRLLMLKLAHDDQLYGGHLGVRKTLKKLRSYWWHGIANDVAQYVKTCETCQRFKNPPGPKIGRLHPIPVSVLFERLHIDIIGPMHTPTIHNNNYILTAIDAYSRFAFAKPYLDSRTTFCIEFLEAIISIHGIPKTIVSDQGPQFTSVEWADVMRKYGIKHNFTNPYHPQSNGMDERLNGTLVKILKSCVAEKPNDWDKQLKWALFTYNTTFHESLRMTPYEVMFGVKPRTPLNLQPNNPLEHNEARRLIRETVEANTAEARRVQKYFYDRNRRTSEFQVGDSVLLRHHNISKDVGRKFQEKWIGPAVILRVHRPFPDVDPTYVEVILFADPNDNRKKAQIKSIPICDLKPFYLRTDSEQCHLQLGVEALNSRSQNRPTQDIYIPQHDLFGFETDRESTSSDLSNQQQEQTQQPSPESPQSLTTDGNIQSNQENIISEPQPADNQIVVTQTQSPVTQPTQPDPERSIDTISVDQDQQLGEITLPNSPTRPLPIELPSSPQNIDQENSNQNCEPISRQNSSISAQLIEETPENSSTSQNQFQVMSDADYLTPRTQQENAQNPQESAPISNHDLEIIPRQNLTILPQKEEQPLNTTLEERNQFHIGSEQSNEPSTSLNISTENQQTSSLQTQQTVNSPEHSPPATASQPVNYNITPIKPEFSYSQETSTAPGPIRILRNRKRLNRPRRFA